MENKISLSVILPIKSAKAKDFDETSSVCADRVSCIYAFSD